jgi:hypothetical protein
MAREAKIKKQKINKKLLLKKFVEIPAKGSRLFYMKEMTLLNALIERYSEEFVLVLKLPKKYDSMAIILCESYREQLDKKFKHFNYVFDDSKYEDIILQEHKSGEDIEVNIKPKTIKDFLNG